MGLFSGAQWFRPVRLAGPPGRGAPGPSSIERAPRARLQSSRASCFWDELGDEPFEAPPGKPLIVASYLGGDIPTAYVEPVGVCDALPSLPIFLSERRYIPAPLEATYQEAWAIYPAMIKELIETPGKD
ncbi:MAG: hypothetical protein ACYC61_20045 [Isosphaeraceae bacterium]